MKKVGAKPGQLVRSASRRNKSPARFQFDLTVERVFGTITHPGSSYFVKWARGVKVAQTRAVTASREHTGGSRTAGGLPFAEKLSLLVTLYRTGDAKFDEKDAKLALIYVSPKGQERTVAKTHFDLSAFAGVPSATASKILKLSDKASLKLTIDARLVKAGKRTGSAGASSALSGMTGTSGVSSEEEDEDDFGDLDIDDVPEPESPRSARASQSSASGAPALDLPRTRRQSSAARRSGPSSTSSASARSPAPPSPANGGNGHLSSTDVRRQASRPSSTSAAAAAASSASSAAAAAPAADRSNEELARLRAEIASLKDESEKAAIDVRRAADKRKRMEAAHEAELAALRAKLSAAPVADGSASRALSAERRRADDALAKVDKLQAELASLSSERDAALRDADGLRASARETDSLRESNRGLSREVDRLTAVAAATGSGTGADDEVQRRLNQLQQEKQALQNKITAHEKHAAKVKGTYRQLTDMYNTLRDENGELNSRVEELEEQLKQANVAADAAERKAMEASAAAALAASKATRAASGEGLASGIGTSDGANGSLPARELEENVVKLEAELSDMRAALRDSTSSKESLEREAARNSSQIQSLQTRLEQASAEKDDARKESDALASEVAELTAQRDSALARAEKAGEAAGALGPAAALEAKLAEAMKSRENAEREVARVNQRVSELEREVTDMTEDLDYEKAEKTKAREERDALRESARALERRTSQVSQTADTVHALKRQLSTHKMREADQAAMIADLREEVEDLRSQVNGGSSGSHLGGGGLLGGPTRDDAMVLEDLVMAKLALATAEDEKLQLQLQLRNQHKTEKAIQERLAAHASRLEVKLAEANDELARARVMRNSEDDGSLV